MLIGAWNFARETMGKFLIDLETTLPDRRPQSGTNFVALCSNAFHHAYTLWRNVCNDTAPSCMKRRNNFARVIHHQNRHAIRARHCQKNSGFIGDHAIALRLLIDGGASYHANRAPVDLMASRDRCVADGFAKPAPVLIDVRALVADPVREVEALVRAGTDTADAPEKSVSQLRIIPDRENRNRDGCG